MNIFFVKKGNNFIKCGILINLVINELFVYSGGLFCVLAIKELILQLMSFFS